MATIVEEFEPQGRERAGPERLRWRITQTLRRWRRKLPYLVWFNDELDVTVTLKENPLRETDNFEDALTQLNSGPLYHIEMKLSELGVTFDKGMGYGGRDWEWDWSLSGPISIKFRGRSREPQKRQ